MAGSAATAIGLPSQTLQLTDFKGKQPTSGSGRIRELPVFFYDKAAAVPGWRLGVLCCLGTALSDGVLNPRSRRKGQGHLRRPQGFHGVKLPGPVLRS